jgi:hypothetical protein
MHKPSIAQRFMSGIALIAGTRPVIPPPPLPAITLQRLTPRNERRLARKALRRSR